MGRRDEFSVRKSVRPSVYTLTDRQLADEYQELTGAPVEQPGTCDPVYWRRWRSDLQLRVLEERVARLARWCDDQDTSMLAKDPRPFETRSEQAHSELCAFLRLATGWTR